MIHEQFPMSYAMNNDFKYQASGRQQTTNSISSGGYLDRKDLGHGSLNSSMSIGASNSGMDYTVNQMQHDVPCNPSASQLALTPPNSGDESTTSSLNQATSSYSYAGSTKLAGGNVLSSDYYANAASNYLPTGFDASSMTSLHHQKYPMRMPVPLSPPYPNYNPPAASGGCPPFSNLVRPTMDYNISPYTNNRYRTTDPFYQARSTFSPYNGMQIGQAIHIPPPRQEGPTFEDTQKLHSLSNARGQPLSVIVQASIPKGFFRVEDKWTCYRRNYFTVTCGFNFKTPQYDSQVYLSRNNHPEQIHGYAVSISAKTAATNPAESEQRGLVQHTPKRDKATESVPTRHAILPASSSGLNASHISSYFSNASHMNSCLPSGMDHFGQSSTQAPQTQHTFERIQFQKATQNNGKRRAHQQYFHVVVNLEVNVGRPGGPDDWVTVASTQSQPMVVRGRSPGHYKDNRRDSQTSMDPDGDSGHGDNHTSTYSMHPLGPSMGGSMSSATNYRHSHQYGSSSNSYALHDSDSASSSSDTPSNLCSTSTKNDYNYTSISRPSTYSGESMVLSPIQPKYSGDSHPHYFPKKRTYEDEATECPSGFFTSNLDANYQNPSFDFSATSGLQPLCASS